MKQEYNQQAARQFLQLQNLKVSAWQLLAQVQELRLCPDQEEPSGQQMGLLLYKNSPLFLHQPQLLHD